jgi:hypothetical protein
MYPCNEVFQATPFDASSNEPLIAAGDAEEDRRLEEKVFSRFQFSSLLLGLLVGFFIQLSTVGASFLVIWGEVVISSKSKTDIAVFSLLWSFFTSAMPIVILGFLRDLVAITYSTVRGHSNDLLEDMVSHMECRFGAGILVGFFLALTLTDVVLGMRNQSKFPNQ